MISNLQELLKKRRHKEMNLKNIWPAHKLLFLSREICLITSTTLTNKDHTFISSLLRVLDTSGGFIIALLSWMIPGRVLSLRINLILCLVLSLNQSVCSFIIYPLLIFIIHSCLFLKFTALIFHMNSNEFFLFCFIYIFHFLCLLQLIFVCSNQKWK